MKQKYIILQNMITPYRNSLFNKLAEMGMDIEVLYMCKLEKGRSWKIDYSSMKFQYLIDERSYRTFRGIPLHWNPKLIKIMRNAKEAKVILGSSWNDLNVIACCILKRLGLFKPEIIFWSEANYQTNGARRKNRFRDWLRSFVYGTGEGRVIVPGQMAIESFKRWGINNKRFLLLPNVIEEETIMALADKTEHKPSAIEELPRFVLPVRLEEKIKGIVNFFKAIGRDNVLSARFDILGDGNDEMMIRQFIEENHYEEHIFLRGFCPMDVVTDYYLHSDGVILPSFTDPSPLSIVEACCCGLPLFISSRCGNHFETLAEGENGYSFDPDNVEEIKTAFESLMNRRSDWAEMGKRSRKLFEENFKQEITVKRFVEEIERG